MREDDRENQPSPDLETPALAQSTMTPKVASFLLLLAGKQAFEKVIGFKQLRWAYSCEKFNF